MSMSVAHDLSPAPPTLAADKHRADGLLFDLAMELRRITVEERTRYLHLRALALKGRVMRWSEDQPDEVTRLALCDEVIALLEETRNWRGRLRSATRWTYRDRLAEQGK